MAGELSALAAKHVRRDAILGQLPGAVFFFDHPLDRQPVAVPARDIGRILADHLLGPVDDVLQDFVQRMADMQMAIGIRRPIMQDEFLAPGCGLAQPLVKTYSRPTRQNGGLPLWQIATHRELGFRQKDGGSVIGRHRKPSNNLRMSGSVPILTRGPGR